MSTINRAQYEVKRNFEGEIIGTDKVHLETNTTQVYDFEKGVFLNEVIDDVLDSVGDVANLQTTNKTNLVEAINEVKSKTYAATIGTTWIGASAPYTQTVTVAGILATDNPIISPVYSTTLATALLQKEAYNCISKAVTSANAITFTCFEEKPVTAIPIQIKVVR